MNVDEATIFRLLDRWWAQRQRRETTEQLTATVYGVPDTSRNLLVTLAAGQQPIPVHRPASPTPYAAGDRVVITRGPEGFLLAGPPLDRDPTASIVPTDDGEDPDEDGDPTLHTLGLHTVMGLARLTDIEDHADLPSHLLSYNTPNTGSADEGKWAQLGEGSILAKFGDVTVDARISGGGTDGATWSRGFLRFKVLQLADFGTDPEVVLELSDFADITGDDIAIVVTDNAGPSTFELHVRVTREYEWSTITPLRTHNQRAQWEWMSCSAFAAALP